MTYRELVDGVLERFDETTRTDAKRWVNAKYAMVWALERWTFKYVSELASVTVSSDALTTTTTFARIRRLWNSTGDRLIYMSPEHFWAIYHYGKVQGTTGLPESYTVVNDIVALGPVSSETSSNYRIVGLRRFSELSADADTPLLPSEFHWMLIPGAQAHGQALRQDPAATLNEQLFRDGIDSMRRDYLMDVAAEPEFWGRRQ